MPTEKPMSIRPVNSQCSRQQELASGSDVQRVQWNGGPKCLSTGLFVFPSPKFPARPNSSTDELIKLRDYTEMDIANRRAGKIVGKLSDLISQAKELKIDHGVSP